MCINIHLLFSPFIQEANEIWYDQLMLLLHTKFKWKVSNYSKLFRATSVVIIQNYFVPQVWFS